MIVQLPSCSWVEYGKTVLVLRLLRIISPKNLKQDREIGFITNFNIWKYLSVWMILNFAILVLFVFGGNPTLLAVFFLYLLKKWICPIIVFLIFNFFIKKGELSRMNINIDIGVMLLKIRVQTLRKRLAKWLFSWILICPFWLLKIIKVSWEISININV
jgi:hypothetical protein